MSEKTARRHPSALVRELGIPALALFVTVVLWEVLVRAFRVPEFLLPAPSSIASESWSVAGNLGMHGLATLRTVLLGFVVSVAISLPMALAITSSPAVGNAIYPLLVLTQSVPKVALAPLLVVILGANELPRVVVTFLVAFFPLVISISTGLLAVPPELLELGRACKATWRQELVRIRLPYAVPFIFSGFKVAITLCVVGAVVAEFVNADQGLGYLIVTSTAFFKVPLAFGAVILLSVMGIVLFQLIVVLERWLFPWSAAGNQREVH
ncbi:ABC transporter permease [Variovorax sp. LjRoot130]|jgi:NitT/TauT family transport system permease protein|uniref:ABC transporter permease n=1 Tax=Variovorax sp. LjRoot130 TaxID=3342261 RepID=UPI003ECCE8E6